MKLLLDETLKNVYIETEIDYLIKIVKNKNPSENEMSVQYEKALDTLEVLMWKIGLKDSFEKLVENYEVEKKEGLR